ncbi:MAG: MMPL family transporter [Pseudomonadota bacterium]
MSLPKSRFPWLLIVLVVVGVVVLFLVGRQRLAIDSDLVASLPQNDPVVAAARSVIAHHPIQERVVIDLGHRGSDPDRLISAAELVEKGLRESGLFKTVGLSRHQQLFPELISYVIDHFPVLFSEQDLKEKVEPLLTPDNIRRTLQASYQTLTSLEGIGLASLLTRDPLDLRNIVLRRLAMLGSGEQVVMIKGQLLSSDRKHLIIIAEPASSGFDTAVSQKITNLIEAIGRQLNLSPGGDSFTLTPVGAYRAALDNETAAKTDTHRAVLISTMVIALLLLLGFPRPWIGLLALLPALGGTVGAWFVYSLFQKSISILAIGFGGAIISFTVDYGIAYLLFLDRPHETKGFEVTKEVWSLGLLAMLTTAVSFACLFMAGFPALTQLGVFASLGVVLTYIFVHAIYPFLFPVVLPARRRGLLPLQWLADRLARGGLGAVWAAGLLALVMLFFARPDFRVDLQSMNTISSQSRAAEKLVQDIWGNVMSRVFLAVEGKTIAELQEKEDQLADLLDKGLAKGTLASAFSPAMLFPGEHRAKRNFEAWQAFWTKERLNRLRQEIASLSPQAGFARGAFAPFFLTLDQKAFSAPRIPPAFFPLLSIEKQPGKNWTHYATVQPGVAYQREAFYQDLVSKNLATVFDPVLFSDRLGEVILNGFLRVVLIVGVMTFLVSLLYLFHWRLTLVALIPTLFSVICTLGTLRLLGQTLGVPVIMAAAIVIGMGTDYALYLVRAHQRYRDEDHPSVGLIRLSVFLSFATTSIGFWVLALSGHALLRSAGMVLALGIGYSFLGTMAFVPPLIKKILAPITFSRQPVLAGSKQHVQRTIRRYRNMEGYPRLLVRFKLRFDPLFPRLADFIRDPGLIVDIGSGYGIPAVWLLELFPSARIYGLEPDRKRALFASQAIGDRGQVIVGAAPDIPEFPEQADTALLLDILPYLNDQDLAQTLRRLKEVLGPKGRLIIRTKVPALTAPAWRTWLEKRRQKFLKIPGNDRRIEDIETILTSAGFVVIPNGPSGNHRKERWIIAEPV